MTSDQPSAAPILRELLASGAKRLVAASDRDPAAGTFASSDSRREAELLLGHAIARDRAWLYAHADDRMEAATVTQFQQLLARRIRGEPLAYLLGRREFWSLDLIVTPDVLIPRPETELLVELALHKVAPDSTLEIADLGTGSGAVAVALAHERPRARVIATDLSEPALAIARVNAGRAGLSNVSFELGDWCAALGSRRVDLIVANPPYIAEADPHLTQGDLRFEPRAALASGVRGLDAIASIIAAAPDHLRAGGWLLFEHGHDQGDVARLLLQQSGFMEIFTEPDLERRDRVSGGRIAQ